MVQGVVWSGGVSGQGGLVRGVSGLGGCLVWGCGLGGFAPPRQNFFFDSFGDPPGSRLRHMVNERPVRILLECILV